MAIKPHRATRTARSRSAITASAPFLCRSCYERRYGVRIPTEAEHYKARLLEKLGRYADAFPDERDRDLVSRIMRLIDSIV